MIIYLTGGGTGFMGMWKAFEGLEASGWLRDAKRLRMVVAQADGCAPVVKAFETGPGLKYLDQLLPSAIS